MTASRFHIRFRTGPTGEAGPFVARYHNSAGIVSLGVTLLRDWPVGLNLDPMIFDMQGDGGLDHVDIRMSPGIALAENRAAPSARYVRLYLTPNRWDAPEVVVVRHRAEGRVIYRFDDRAADRELALGPGVFALAAGDELLGFSLQTA